MIHSGVHIHAIQRTVLASNTDSLFRQSVWSLYLPLGSMGPYFDFVKILPGEEVCSQALGSVSWLVFNVYLWQEVVAWELFLLENISSILGLIVEYVDYPSLLLDQMTH